MATAEVSLSDMDGSGTPGVLLHGARVVTPGGVLDDGWVSVTGGVIDGVGDGPAPSGVARGVDLRGAWLLPGFVDLHVHGGGGHDASASAESLAAAVAFHRARGTTRTLVSLVTAPEDALTRALADVADLAERDDHVLGAHLEGPYLSALRCGAQNPAYLRAPDRAEFARLAAAARGRLRVITLAPELPGALDVLTDAVAGGVVAAVGHTDATYAQARAAFDAGATLATHLFNGMRPLHHREPGPVGAALAAGVACELINDGVHTHPSVAGVVAERGGRLVLITDALAAAGTGDGDIELGGLPVHVRDGRARLASGALAGSLLTMDVAFRRAVLDGGLSVPAASAAASTHPARVLGEQHRFGSISPGLAADLVVLDPQLRLVGVLAGGRRVPSSDSVAPSP